MKDTPELTVYKQKPPRNLTFWSEDRKQVGELNWNTGKLIFTGDADESAKKFFDWVKYYVDEYIATARAQGAEEERERLKDAIEEKNKREFGEDLGYLHWNDFNSVTKYDERKWFSKLLNENAQPETNRKE